MTKSYPVDKEGEFCVELTEDELRVSYNNRSENNPWVCKYLLICKKDNPYETILKWNPFEKRLIEYLISNKIGKYTIKTEDNYDSDPSGRRVVRGTRTYYYFCFTDLW